MGVTWGLRGEGGDYAIAMGGWESVQCVLQSLQKRFPLLKVDCECWKVCLLANNELRERKIIISIFQLWADGECRAYNSNE